MTKSPIQRMPKGVPAGGKSHFAPRPTLGQTHPATAIHTKALRSAVRRKRTPIGPPPMPWQVAQPAPQGPPMNPMAGPTQAPMHTAMGPRPSTQPTSPFNLFLQNLVNKHLARNMLGAGGGWRPTG